MSYLITVAWAVSLAGCVLSLTGSSLAHLAGAVGWIALGFSFSHAGVVFRERRRIGNAYKGILSVAKSGMCIHGERFDCRCPSVETCGACWASVMGLEPEEWLEWYMEREQERDSKCVEYEANGSAKLTEKGWKRLQNTIREGSET